MFQHRSVMQMHEDSNLEVSTIVHVLISGFMCGGDSLKPLFYDGDLFYIKHIHSECEASDEDFVIGTTPFHRCRMMRMTNGKPASLRFYLPGEKHDEEPVTITGLVLGVVNPQDLAAPEDIPILEEYHRDEIKALEKKCKN